MVLRVEDSWFMDKLLHDRKKPEHYESWCNLFLSGLDWDLEFKVSGNAISV